MCKIYKFFYKLIPLKSFKSLLIKKHFSVCSFCQKESKIDSQLKEILAPPSWIKKEESLWPQISLRLHPTEKEAPRTERKHDFSFPKKWQWAMASLVLVAAIALSLWIQQNFLKRASEDAPVLKGNPRVWIKQAEIKGKKAKPYIYQTTDKSFIWFSETKNSGG